MKSTSALLLSATIAIFIFLTGCTTDSGFRIQEPTFETVPAPFDLGQSTEEPVVDGITKYVVEEGIGVDQVVIRDQVAIFITLRNLEGEIIYSTYQNGNEVPNTPTVQSILTPRPPSVVRNFAFDRARTDGLRKGIIGMKEGEKRVLIVPPAQGFESISSSSINAPFREDTLRYDIELDFIL